MPVATWNGHEIARSDDTVVVEPALLEDSATHSHCPWKGVASYKTLVVDGKRNVDAVWYYPDPMPAAAEINGRYAFWKGVTVE
jgi:uncharacterized protein (DUF427 family)